MMRGRIGGLATEMLFVLSAVGCLKEWVFPFFIWQWFPSADTASQMLEWVFIVVGVMTLFIYIALGSSAKNSYGLTTVSSLGVYLAIHLPLLLVAPTGGNPSAALWWQKLSVSWWGLIGEGVELFVPARWMFHPYTIFLLAGGLFLLGRWVRVVDEENREEAKHFRMSRGQGDT